MHRQQSESLLLEKLRTTREGCDRHRSRGGPTEQDTLLLVRCEECAEERTHRPCWDEHEIVDWKDNMTLLLEAGKCRRTSA